MADNDHQENHHQKPQSLPMTGGQDSSVASLEQLSNDAIRRFWPNFPLSLVVVFSSLFVKSLFG